MAQGKSPFFSMGQENHHDVVMARLGRESRRRNGFCKSHIGILNGNYTGNLNGSGSKAM